MRNIHKKWQAVLVFAMFALLTMVLCVSAAQPGWNKEGDKIFYNFEKVSETGTEFVAAVGLQQIKDDFYYFDTDGVLQTGFVSTQDGYRYFAPVGGPGEIGKMAVGLCTIDGGKYFFSKNGVMAKGFIITDEGAFFLRTAGVPGVVGRAVVKAWKKVKGLKRYFGEDGVMLTDQWVGKYYVDEDGARLKNAVTPDGYVVGANGKKVGTTKVKGLVKINGELYYYKAAANTLLKNKFKKIKGKRYFFDAKGRAATGLLTFKGKTYFFDEEHVMQTGVVDVEEKSYLFNEKGILVTNGTMENDGYATDENGVILESPIPRILIVAGHGQGDGGATSVLGTEYLKTREFAKLVYTELAKSDKVEVQFYKDGSTSFDLYQQNKATLGSAGANMSDSITGKGTVKSKVVAEMAKNKNLPVLNNYKYVLEVHFNATAESNKDIGGNGVCKGYSYYVNSYKKNYALENKTIAKIRSLGYAMFGTGVHASSTLFNARICQELGVDYSLVETAFIDDRDDMNFYNANKEKMAKAVASTIIEYYG